MASLIRTPRLLDRNQIRVSLRLREFHGNTVRYKKPAGGQYGYRKLRLARLTRWVRDSVTLTLKMVSATLSASSPRAAPLISKNRSLKSNLIITKLSSLGLPTAAASGISHVFMHSTVEL